jgi:integrase
VIRRKGQSWEVRVYAGRDPVTGKERYVSRSFPAKPSEKVPPRVVKDAESRLRTEVRDGHHPNARITVAQALDAWYAQTSKEWSPWTAKGYRGIIDRYVKPEIGNMPLAKLTAARLDALYHSLSETGGESGAGLSPMTVNHVHAVIRRALNRAERHGHIPRNPASLAHRPPTHPTRANAATTVDVERLLAVCTDPTTSMLIRLAAGTGARRGELCALRWTDIDLEDRTVTVARSIADPDGKVIVKPTKTNRSRRFTIGARLAAALVEHRARAEEIAAAFSTKVHPDAYVLSESPDGAEPLRPERATGRFRSVAKRANVDCRLHDLRHGHVTLLISEGIGPAEVAARVGHASTHMTLNVYAHALPAGDRRAAEVADRF